MDYESSGSVAEWSRFIEARLRLGPTTLRPLSGSMQVENILRYKSFLRNECAPHTYGLLSISRLLSHTYRA